MQKTALPFVACLLALAAAGAHAQTLWKWRDAAGQLHISDTAPPVGTPSKNIISAPPGGVVVPSALTAAPPASAARSDAGAAASGAETALDKKKKAADKERADKEATDRAALEAKNNAIRADNCSRARSALTGIQSGQRIARVNANGEREFLDDAARADELKRTQDAIASNCGAAPAAR
jgi:uncharacterized protein DUF4124